MDAPLSVSQFNRMVKQLVECERLSDIVVVGELKEYKPSSGGHVYPVLTDGSSVIPCTLFKSVVSRLNFQPKVGMKVEVFGSASYYEPYGKLSFNIRGMKPAGEGDEKKKLEELKLKLIGEGLFERKRPLPRYPRTIGVVTSQTGAVIKDIVDTARRRFPANILLAPAKVQGDGAAESIVAGIEMLNREGVDIIIVGRGGGSADDLKAFNEEIVARAVAASDIPVISAVGHEPDFTLCDFAADVRAGTPSIAAEIAVPVKTELLQQVNDLAARLKRAPERAGEVFAQRIDHLSVRLSSALRNSASSAEMRLAKSAQRLVPALKDAVAAAESRLLKSSQRILPALKDAVAAAERSLTGMDQKLLTPLKDSVARNERRLATAEAKLKLLDPSNPLKRGYSLTLGADGGIIRSVSSVKPGDTLHTRLADGEISSKVSG